ncbi:hypothetical protein V5799_014344 [Amblyomma americanum]|uniref:Peptidase M12B domain-containing protein n=1 Tax=Amblyomma americanum TaxID=6943 RepID=A0AAQ4E3B6_AMBAM
MCEEDFVAMAEDVPGSYSGVLNAAHEIGHSMGASHDGSPPDPHIFGHPGSLKCNASSGHIMTYVDGGALRYRFSECSKDEIRHVLRQRGSRCWKIQAKEIYSVENIYPGRILSAHQYCHMLYPKKEGVFSKTDTFRSRYCKLRCCAHLRNGSEICVVERMLDLMRCGYLKRCFQGVCRDKADLERKSQGNQ